MKNWREFRCLPLLLVIMGSIFASPLIDAGGAIGVAIGLGVAGAIAWAGYLLVGTGRWLRVYFLATLIFIALWIVDFVLGESEFSEIFSHLLSAMLVVTTFYIVLRHALFDKGALHIDRIIAAACGYLLLGLLWMRFYMLLLHADPGALIDNVTGVAPDGPAVAYYSLVTLTTQGYGDIAPVAPLTRLIAASEGVIGTLYLAVVISALVGLIRPGSKRSQSP
jgi:hypothetical protein